jgi:hypothetical protein
MTDAAGRPRAPPLWGEHDHTRSGCFCGLGPLGAGGRAWHLVLTAANPFEPQDTDMHIPSITITDRSPAQLDLQGIRDDWATFPSLRGIAGVPA